MLPSVPPATTTMSPHDGERVLAEAASPGVEQVVAHPPAVTGPLDPLHVDAREDARRPSGGRRAGSSSRSVFLAPMLQPLTQSPQPEQAGCSTPASLTPASNVTLMSGSRNGMADARGLALEHRGLGERDSVLRVRRRSEHRAGAVHAGLDRRRRSARRAFGHRSSSKIRGSGSMATLAFTSDVPPRPQPLNTLMSSSMCSSYSAWRLPMSCSGVWTWKSSAALSDAVRELAGEHLRAAFDEADVASRAGEPRRHDRPAVARSDDHHLVPLPEITRSACDPLHRQSPFVLGEQLCARRWTSSVPLALGQARPRGAAPRAAAAASPSASSLRASGRRRAVAAAGLEERRRDAPRGARRLRCSRVDGLVVAAEHRGQAAEVVLERADRRHAVEADLRRERERGCRRARPPPRVAQVRIAASANSATLVM